MSDEARDELALELFIGDNGNQPREASMADWAYFHYEVKFLGRVEHYKAMAEHALAAGYRKVDHTEFALDHKLSDLQFTDDDGELWTDEEDVKDYADEYGDTAALVQRHVTEWEPVK